MSRAARSVVSISLMWATVCATAVCRDEGSAEAEGGSESEESSGDGDGDSGDGDGDSGDGDGDGDSGDGDGDGDPGDGDGDDKLDMPLGLEGCVIHVDGQTGSDGNLGLTWVDAKATIQAGLDAASSREDCAVWVAEGTYHPTDGGPSDDRNASFTLAAGQHLYGGFAGTELSLEQRDWVAHPTILSGDIGVLGDASDNSAHVVKSDSGGRIDGFEIRDGCSQGFSALEGRDGAGIHALGGSLIVANSRIDNNRTGSGLDAEIGAIGGHGGNGAGIYMIGGALTLENVTLSGNQTGSGGQGSATGGNGGLGAGLHANGTVVVIRDSVFTANQTGDGGDGMFTFGGLGGDGAGLYVVGGELTLEDVSISDGQTGSGGQGGSQGGHGGLAAGLHAVNTIIEIRDSVFASNHTGDGGEGINNFGGHGGSGAGAWIVGGSVVIVETVFEANVTGIGGPGGGVDGSRGAYGGLWYVANAGSSLVIANTEFVGNDAASAAGALLQTANAAGASVLVVNSVFRGNLANYSNGGLQLNGDGSASVEIANSAFVANSALSGAGLGYVPLDAIGPEQPRLVNSIVWGNVGQFEEAQIFSNSAAQTPLNLLIDATDIEGGCVGATDNLECVQTHDLDPEFVDLMSGDLHLMPGSPLLDLGLADHLPPDLADLDDDGDVDEPTPLDLDMLERVVADAPELGPLEVP